jgi:hypothetical protein
MKSKGKFISPFKASGNRSHQGTVAIEGAKPLSLNKHIRRTTPLPPPEEGNPLYTTGDITIPDDAFMSINDTFIYL